MRTILPALVISGNPENPLLCSNNCKGCGSVASLKWRKKYLPSYEASPFYNSSFHCSITQLNWNTVYSIHQNPLETGINLDSFFGSHNRKWKEPIPDTSFIFHPFLPLFKDFFYMFQSLLSLAYVRNQKFILKNENKSLPYLLLQLGLNFCHLFLTHLRHDNRFPLCAVSSF